MSECPLCNTPITLDNLFLQTTWQEMESDERKSVCVHYSCAWQAIRDQLYEMEAYRKAKERWVGWEPLDALLEKAHD